MKHSEKGKQKLVIQTHDLTPPKYKTIALAAKYFQTIWQHKYFWLPKLVAGSRLALVELAAA